MSDYTELVKALRHCVSDEKGVTKCAGCPYYPDITGCMDRLHTDAAAAIEELDAEETRLLLLTSDLQDKLMDLQAEVNRLELDNEDYEHENRRLHGEIEALQAQLPKRGEWEREMDVYDEPFYQCSVCGECFDSNNDSTHEVFKYCPDCGAKMEVQE